VIVLILRAPDYLRRAVASSNGTTVLIGWAPTYFSPFGRNHVGVELAPSRFPSATSSSIGFSQSVGAVGSTRLSIRSFHAFARSFEHQTDFVWRTDSSMMTGHMKMWTVTSSTAARSFSNV